MKNEVGFLITAFDQIREVAFTINMLRTKWTRTREAPIVLVVSGDHNRRLMYNDDPLTRVVHLDDIVGEHFKTLVSTSIMKQLEHGMILNITLRDVTKKLTTVGEQENVHTADR